MKKNILMALMVLSTVAFSPIAQAVLVSRSVSCKSPTHQAINTVSDSVYTTYSIFRIGQDAADGFIMLDADSGKRFTEAEYANADVLYLVNDQKNLTHSKISDESYDTIQLTSKAQIIFTKISSAAAKKLVIYKNQKMEFVCDEETKYTK